MAGYSPVKEFYSPDYSIPADLAKSATDFRTTLYWQPDIVADQETKTIRITFYNNDFPDKLKLVLEGINEAGQLTRTEKWLE